MTSRSQATERPADDATVDRFLTLREVITIAGIKKTMIYRLIKKGTFPKPYKPGGESSRWDAAEVRAWRARIMSERDAT